MRFLCEKFHKGKAVPQRAYGDARRGGIAPTHSWPRHEMGWVVSVRPRPRFTPRERTPPLPIGQEAGWAPEPVWTQRLEEKSSCLCRRSNLDRPVVQSVARHYTDWATPAPKKFILTNILQRMVMNPIPNPPDASSDLSSGMYCRVK
jgi:hypothetical protein